MNKKKKFTRKMLNAVKFLFVVITADMSNCVEYVEHKVEQSRTIQIYSTILKTLSWE